MASTNGSNGNGGSADEPRHDDMPHGILSGITYVVRASRGPKATAKRQTRSNAVDIRYGTGGWHYEMQIESHALLAASKALHDAYVAEGSPAQSGADVFTYVAQTDRKTTANLPTRVCPFCGSRVVSTGKGCPECLTAWDAPVPGRTAEQDAAYDGALGLLQ